VTNRIAGHAPPARRELAYAGGGEHDPAMMLAADHDRHGPRPRARKSGRIVVVNRHYQTRRHADRRTCKVDAKQRVGMGFKRTVMDNTHA
jgi:hypothetical protein